MLTTTCYTCRHYILHYRKIGKTTYLPVHCGHCAAPRLKTRQPDTEACKYWEAKTPENLKDLLYWDSTMFLDAEDIAEITAQTHEKL